MSIKEIKKLIEQINKFAEEEMVDDFEGAEVTDTHLDASTDTNTTEQLDAKTKISRALDVLKKAVEDFKDSTVEEIDLVNDSALMQAIESLDAKVSDIEQTLTGFETKPETEMEPVEAPEEDNEEDSDEDAEEEYNFDDEASLDLFGTDTEE